MPTTALLVIDVQRGAFDGQRLPPIDRPEVLVDHAVSLVSAAHSAGKPVIFIQHCEQGADELFVEGTAQWELHDRLAPRPGDTLIKKQASSAFEATDLGAVLTKLDATELVLCGLQSEFCVFNTASAALALGYKVLIAEDGHSTWPSGGKSATAISDEVNARLLASGATLQSTERLAQALNATGA